VLGRRLGRRLGDTQKAAAAGIVYYVGVYAEEASKVLRAHDLLRGALYVYPTVQNADNVMGESTQPISRGALV
jgi:hypothetical protein